MSSHKRLIFKATILGYLALITQMMIQALTLPLIVRHLGKEAVGAYSFLLQVLGFVTILELGFSVALSQRLTQAATDRNTLSLAETRLAGRLGFFLAGSLYFLVLGCLASFSDFLEHFGGFQNTRIRESLAILALSSFLKAQVQFYAFSLASQNQLWAVHLGTLGGLLVRGGLFVLVVKLDLGFQGLVCAYAVSDLATSFFHLLLHPKIPRLPRALLREGVLANLRKIAKFGRSLAPMQFASRIMYSSDSIVAGIILGPVAVAALYASQMPAFLLFQTLFICTDSFLPHLTHLHASSNRGEFLRYCQFLVRLSLAMATSVFFGVLIFNRGLIEHWVGGDLFAGGAFTFFLAIFCALQLASRPLTLFLIAAGDLRGWGVIALVGALIKLGLSFGLGKGFGVVGIMAATAVVELPLSFVLIKKCSSSLHGFLAFLNIKEGKALLLHFMILALTAGMLQAWSTSPGAGAFIGKLCIFAIVNCFSFLWSVLTREEIRLVVERFPIFERILKC